MPGRRYDAFTPFHRAQVELREAAPQAAIEQAEDEAQTRRLNLHAATAAHTVALDAAVQALERYVLAREQLIPVREAYDDTRRASLAAGDPVPIPDTFDQGRLRDSGIAKPWDRAQSSLAFAGTSPSGDPVGHWGGRYIWQLSDSDELRVAWKRCEEGPTAAELESEIVGLFMKRYGCLPFANTADPT